MKARAPKISARFFVSSRGGCGRLASAANASLPEGGMTGKPAKREAISPDNPRTIPGQPASKKNFGRPRFKRKAGLRLLCAAAPIIFRTSDGQTNFKRLPPRTAGRTHARRNRAQQNKTRMQTRPEKNSARNFNRRQTGNADSEIKQKFRFRKTAQKAQNCAFQPHAAPNTQGKIRFKGAFQKRSGENGRTGFSN